MTFSILYEDNHLLVVNKPAGWLTQPNGTEQSSLEECVKKWIKETYQKPGNVFLAAVHRLDKPVSGIVLFARTSKALSRLNAFFRDKKASKTYIALVEGQLPQNEGLLEHYLRHDDFQASIARKTDPEAKLARLSYRKLKMINNVTLVEIELETGRYHQIRAQFSAIGCPIMGDRRYGSQIPLENEMIALHHNRFEIQHPITNEKMTFQAPWPHVIDSITK